MEAVPAQVVPLPPLPRQGEGPRGGRQVGVEGGVEAGHRRQVGGYPAYGIDRVQGDRLVQRGERRERPEVGQQVVGHPLRRDVVGAAVHDAVADRVDVADQVADVVGQVVRRAVPGGDDPVVGVEHPELDAAGPRVDGEDPHACASSSGHCQAWMSGASSPCSRV